MSLFTIPPLKEVRKTWDALWCNKASFWELHYVTTEQRLPCVCFNVQMLRKHLFCSLSQRALLQVGADGQLPMGFKTEDNDMLVSVFLMAHPSCYVAVDLIGRRELCSL